MGDVNPDLIVDMPENSDMKQDATTQADQAVGLYKIESKISQHIKDFFDKKYGPNWHCVVGKHFNGFVSYDNKHFIFFKSGQLAIMLYKKG